MFLGVKMIHYRKKLLFDFSSLKQLALYEILNFQYPWQTDALLLVNIWFFLSLVQNVRSKKYVLLGMFSFSSLYVEMFGIEFNVLVHAYISLFQSIFSNRSAKQPLFSFISHKQIKLLGRFRFKPDNFSGASDSVRDGKKRYIRKKPILNMTTAKISI